ncbi:MAG: FecR family protein, partial [Odoribacter sp.]|nr:FecR family protein [Odoribacter sp.]
MTDYPFQIAILIQKSLVGVLGDEERKQLADWLAESEEHQRMYEEFNRAGFLEKAREEHRLFSSGEGYLRFQSGKKKMNRLRIGRRWTAVAAVCALLVGVALAFFSRTQDGESDVQPVAETIKPGRASAVLTLSDGKQVLLSDTLAIQFKEQAADIRVQGKSLNYSTGDSGIFEGYNTITVPRGAEYQLTLSDGTRVWLNAETELKYPVTFTGEVREVTLEGEAYFEVAKNSARPFVVKSEKLEIKVLGTSFNVKAYPQETQQATLV